MRTMDYHIKQPKGVTYNLNVQRELAAGWGMMVGYAGSRGYDLVSAIEGNPVVPVVRADGSLFFPAGASRHKTARGSNHYPKAPRRPPGDPRSIEPTERD